MTEAIVRAAIYAALDGVANHGMVYDYTRYDADWTTFLTLFRVRIDNADQIRGWEISLTEITQEDADVSGNAWRRYTYQIDGFMGLNDSEATEKTWAGLVEAMINALDDDTTLEAYLFHAPANAVIDYRGYSGALCHHCRITEIVGEEV